jgi:hypothetical protein
MATGSIDSFIDDYVEALHDGNAAVFAGAGLSIPAGVVDWRGLLRGIAREVGLDVRKEEDLVSLAQFHVNKFRGRHAINQALVREFAAHARLTKNHKILASLPIRTYWTTNYDTLIEDALKDCDKTADVKITTANLATTVHRRDALVYKMHGDVSQPDQAVVTKEDYETYSLSRQLFSTALQGDLVSKTFLFVGFSFNDPNLSYVLGRIRSLLGGNVRRHYCLLRKVHHRDFSSRRAFYYARAKQDLQVTDLMRYGIVGLVVDKYSDYTAVLQRVARRFKRSRVFIAGSADDYAPWTESNAHRLLHEIARQLTKEGFGVVSGSGVGVGPYVVNGVLEQLHRDNTRVTDDRLTIRPFPLEIADPIERSRRWADYREQIIGEAGVAVFVFGNKRNIAGGLVPADGVVEEFRVAVRQNVAVVPVGCTGSVAETLHARVLKEFSTHYPTPGYRRRVAALGKKGSPTAVAGRIVALIAKLRDEGE